MKLIILSLLFICVYSYNSGLGCSKTTNTFSKKQLGLSSSSPQYNVDQAFCLSSSKVLIDSELKSSFINDQGVLVNVYQFEWLMIFCNECPHYNIFNISAVDTISVSNLISTDTKDLTIQAVLLNPYLDSPNANNFEIDLSCSPPVSINSTSKVATCNLFGCPSFLPSYSTIDCQCTPDRNCAHFNLTVIGVIEGNSSLQCPSFSGDVSNCVYANGTICSQYSNNPACTNCVAPSPKKKRFPNKFDSIFNDQKKILSQSSSKLSSQSSFNNNNNEQSSFDSSISSLSLPDLFPVCSKSCAAPVSIAYTPSNREFNFTSNMACSLSNDQCTPGRCPTQSCNSAVFNCVWLLRDPFFTNQPFDFTVTLPFIPQVLSPECIVSPLDPTGTTVLCSITSNSVFPLGIEGSYCTERSSSCSNETISSIVSNITTGSCNTINIADSDTNLIIPSLNVTTLTKSAIDFTTGLPIDAIDCTDPSVGSVLVYYRVNVSAPICGPLSISFDDVGQYPIDEDFGINGLLVSDPSTLSCTVNPSRLSFECNTAPNQLSPGQLITVTYRVNVSCSLCNTFDSAACINNVASNNLTNIQALSSTCNVSIDDGQLDFLTPIVCPCPICDCTATLPAFSTVLNSAGVYLKPAGGQNFFNNYLSCSVVSADPNYSSIYGGDYSSPIYGWFIHYGMSKWACDPFNSTDNTLTAHMPLVTSQYTISCCAYQNTKNFVLNAPVVDQSIKTGDPVKFIYYYNDGTQIGQVNTTFTCTNEALSTSFPSHFPIFRKVVG